jgi:hypothetical protein
MRGSVNLPRDLNRAGRDVPDTASIGNSCRDINFLFKTQRSEARSDQIGRSDESK